jgi:Glycosyl transferase family 2
MLLQMAPPGGVSVALPIHRADPTALRDAFASITTQTHRDLDILLVLNGADAGLTRLVYSLAASDPRARVLELTAPCLPRALNTVLRDARHPLVARMDADDVSAPERLERQALFMSANPAIVACGTAWDATDRDGSFVGAEHPPTDPARIRWRLLLGNPFCHGSMMLRREAVLAAGGYDESLPFAQDYDLWLRLARDHRLANLPDLLYHYSADTGRRHRDQAAAASAAMLRAWSALPAIPPDEQPALSALIARATWAGAEARVALAALEQLLDRTGPTREGLLAWQWVAARAHGRDQEKRLALRTAGQRLRAAGVTEVWLYGAGRHTAWLLENTDELGLPIAGIIDDNLVGAECRGRPVSDPTETPTDAHVLISSDSHEEALWEASLPLRARGVQVWRLRRAAGKTSVVQPA